MRKNDSKWEGVGKLEVVGNVPVQILDFVILAKVSFVLFQLSECDATLEKQSVCFHVNAMRMSL